MKHVGAALFAAAFLLPSHSHAETPCDFKGISVGNKMTPAQVMTTLGITKFKTNPARPSFEKRVPLIDKYGIQAAAELEDWDIGPSCDETSCHVPYGVSVGNDNIPVTFFVSLRGSLITEIDVSFSETVWDEMLPVFDQKYGADWKVERSDLPVTNYETKKTTVLKRVSLNHITNGTNQSTKDRCQIWATNLDMIFQHHDALGPYHSMFAIKLISKNF